MLNQAFDAGAFPYSPQMSNDEGIRHNHRALLWYSGAWGRSLPTSIMQIPADLHCLLLSTRIENPDGFCIQRSFAINPNNWPVSLLKSLHAIRFG